MLQLFLLSLSDYKSFICASSVWSTWGAKTFSRDTQRSVAGSTHQPMKSTERTTFLYLRSASLYSNKAITVCCMRFPLNGFWEEEGKKWELFEQCPLGLFIPCLGWWKCQQTILPKPLPVSQAFPGSQDLVLWCGAFPLLHTYKEWWERLSSCGLFLQGKNYRLIIWEMKEHRTSFLNGDTDTVRPRCNLSTFVTWIEFIRGGG